MIEVNNLRKTFGELVRFETLLSTSSRDRSSGCWALTARGNRPPLDVSAACSNRAEELSGSSVTMWSVTVHDRGSSWESCPRNWPSMTTFRRSRI